MKLQIIFDKDRQDKELYTGWGVSFFLDEKILFDTGENGAWLMRNMKMLGADIDKIEAVVISHDHWDHQGGLWELLKKRKGLTVYACPNFSAEFRNRVLRLKCSLKEAKNTTEISSNIFVTGEIAGEYKGEYIAEQAIVAKTENGITVVTGCSHPGIVKIAEKVKSDFPNDRIYLVLGGFHLLDKDSRIIEVIVDRLRDMAVGKVGPTHCSGKVAERLFERKYKENFVSVRTGQNLEI
jgi:7,8-dihydropterin-6-yl-methyl-4-(beta-D-ribofuranosyl)aminobenzene 5'-phosphate synthase